MTFKSHRVRVAYSGRDLSSESYVKALIRIGTLGSVMAFFMRRPYPSHIWLKI